MQFGKISVAFILSALIITLVLGDPGCGDHLAAAGQLCVYFGALPAAIILVVLGLVFDKRKLPAIVAMLLTIGFSVYLFLHMFGLC